MFSRPPSTQQGYSRSETFFPRPPSTQQGYSRSGTFSAIRKHSKTFRARGRSPARNARCFSATFVGVVFDPTSENLWVNSSPQVGRGEQISSVSQALAYFLKYNIFTTHKLYTSCSLAYYVRHDDAYFFCLLLLSSDRLSTGELSLSISLYGSAGNTTRDSYNSSILTCDRPGLHWYLECEYEFLNYYE